MNEPTKQQGDEAEDLARKFAKNYSWEFVLPPSALFKLIADIRTQENNDALERAAFMCNCVANDYAVADDHLPTEMIRSASTGAEKCADEIRAMKVQP